ncbi:MAG: hypothetical protein ACOYL6_15795 [Bacteriovoracaceae bacterium]
MRTFIVFCSLLTYSSLAFSKSSHYQLSCTSNDNRNWERKEFQIKLMKSSGTAWGGTLVAKINDNETAIVYASRIEDKFGVRIYTSMDYIFKKEAITVFSQKDDAYIYLVTKDSLQRPVVGLHCRLEEDEN